MIQPIQLYSNLISKIQPMKKQIPNLNLNLNYATKPDIFVKSTPSIEFTGKKEDAIRSLGNIECPCCGIKMLTDKDFNKIKKGVEQAEGSKGAIEVMKPYEEYMHPVEKECFNLLKEMSKDKPSANFQQLFRENREPFLERLKASENKVLSEVETIAKGLPEKEQEIVKNLTASTGKIIATNDKEIKFKRKTFINEVEDLRNKISDGDIYAKMCKASEKMPTSSNDVNAFVIKYSDRTHSEIAQRLVKLSVGTIEHIKPQSEGGRDDVRNYLLECGGCNHTRSSIPLGDWVTEHPEMIANTQRYMDKVIEFMNKGGLKDFQFYPEAVKETLFNQSDGKLDIKVDMPQTV